MFTLPSRKCDERRSYNLTGALIPKFMVMKGDVQILNGEFVAEVKARANGDDFKTLGRRLAEYDVLFLRRHRQSPLVVLPSDVYLRLMQTYKGSL